MTTLEISSRFSFEGIRAVGIKTSNGNGRDFFADGSEFDWQDNNGLEANDPEVLDAARALAATALLAAEATATCLYRAWTGRPLPENKDELWDEYERLTEPTSEEFAAAKSAAAAACHAAAMAAI